MTAQFVQVILVKDFSSGLPAVPGFFATKQLSAALPVAGMRVFVVFNADIWGGGGVP
jgi:hypothetical protein